MKKFAAILLIFALIMPGALAQRILITESAYPLVTEEGTVAVTDFYLLGKSGDSYMLFADGKVISADAEQVADLLACVGEVEELDAVEAFQKSSKGDKVAELQQALIDLEYLSGAADGDFGGGTEKAVMALQEAVGLPKTGVIDGTLQRVLAILKGSEEEPLKLAYPFVPSPEVKYGAIASRVDFDLTPLLIPELIFSYDDMTDRGAIQLKTKYASEWNDAPDIDKKRFEMQLCFNVQGADSSVALTPELVLTAYGARAPYAQQLILKSGENRVILGEVSLTEGAEGIYAVESIHAALNEDALNLLRVASESGELKIRIEGKYESFDLAPDADMIQAAKIFADAALEIQ